MLDGLHLWGVQFVSLANAWWCSAAISSTINRAPYTFIRSAIWGQYLLEALASGRLRVKPEQTAAHVKEHGALDAGDNSERQRADSAVTLSSGC